VHKQKAEQLDQLWAELLKRVATERPHSLYPIVQVMAGVPALRQRAWNYYVQAIQAALGQNAGNAKSRYTWYQAMSVVMANVPSLFTAAWKLLQPKCTRRNLVQLLIRFDSKLAFRQEVWDRLTGNHQLSNLEWWLIIRGCSPMRAEVWKHIPPNFPKRRLVNLVNDEPSLRKVGMSVLWEYHLNSYEVAQLLIYDAKGKLPGGWRRLRELQPSKSLLWDVIQCAPGYKKSAAAHLLRNYKLTPDELRNLQLLVPDLRKKISSRLPKAKTPTKPKRTSMSIATEIIKISNSA
jgi:hypothetical protein